MPKLGLKHARSRQVRPNSLELRDAVKSGGQDPVVELSCHKATPLAESLIRKIVIAIDEWATESGLSSLPRKVIFEQALAIMTTLYEARNGDRP
jgi:hypothetical protein